MDIETVMVAVFCLTEDVLHDIVPHMLSLHGRAPVLADVAATHRDAAIALIDTRPVPICRFAPADPTIADDEDPLMPGRTDEELNPRAPPSKPSTRSDGGSGEAVSEVRSRTEMRGDGAFPLIDHPSWAAMDAFPAE